MSEHKSKKRKGRSQDELAEMQLIVTIADGEVVKIAALDASGEHRDLSEKEFADIAGEDEMIDLEDALDEAYAAGVNDAIDDSIEGALDADEDEEMLREEAAREILRRSLRRLVLRRALQRGPKRMKARSAQNGAHEVPED